MAVASAGPYASLHLTLDRQSCQHPTTTQFFTDWIPFLLPNPQRQRLKALKAYTSTAQIPRGQVQVPSSMMPLHLFFVFVLSAALR